MNRALDPRGQALNQALLVDRGHGEKYGGTGSKQHHGAVSRSPEGQRVRRKCVLALEALDIHTFTQLQRPCRDHGAACDSVRHSVHVVFSAGFTSFPSKRLRAHNTMKQLCVAPGIDDANSFGGGENRESATLPLRLCAYGRKKSLVFVDEAWKTGSRGGKQGIRGIKCIRPTFQENYKHHVNDSIPTMMGFCI